MATLSPRLDQFIARVHRRLVVVRALERCGACVAAAAPFALIVAAALWWQGRDAFALAVGTLSCGAIVGVMWGLARRPTKHDAAAEADRQLALADLLTTAMAGARSNEPWQAAVVAVAEQRCRSLRPASVLVHRYGGRAWGGIGLSAALVLTVGLLSAVPGENPARARVSEAAHEAAAEAPVAANPKNQRTTVKDPAGERARSEWPDAQRAAPSSQTPDALRGDGTARGSGDQPGGGSRAGQTSASTGSVPPAAGGERAEASGDAAGGGAGGAPAGFPGQTGPAGLSAGDAPHGPIQPRRAGEDGGAVNPSAAMHAVGEGRIPDAYRDVIREYYRPQEPGQ